MLSSVEPSMLPHMVCAVQNMHSKTNKTPMKRRKPATPRMLAGWEGRPFWKFSLELGIRYAGPPRAIIVHARSSS
jgi:hypothetical protein